MIALKPFMDPQVTTFAQPAVQQQMQAPRRSPSCSPVG